MCAFYVYVCDYCRIFMSNESGKKFTGPGLKTESECTDVLLS